MVNSTLSDDALRSLIADATALLESRRKCNTTSLIHGMTNTELRDLVRQICEELDSRRLPSSPTEDEWKYRFQMRPSAKGGRPEIIRYTYIEGKVGQFSVDLTPVGNKGTRLSGEHILRNGDFIAVKYASGRTTYGVPFNGTYIAEDRPQRAVPDVSDDSNILERLCTYAAGVRQELEPEAKKAHRMTLDAIRYYRAELKKLEKRNDHDAVNERLNRQYRDRCKRELDLECQYLDTLARFFKWMGSTIPRS